MIRANDTIKSVPRKSKEKDRRCDKEALESKRLSTKSDLQNTLNTHQSVIEKGQGERARFS